MGRTALFLVLGLGMAMGYIGIQMYHADEWAVQTQYAYMKYMNARNLARAAVHATLRTYDKNDVPLVHVATEFSKGTFQLDSLQASANLDTLRMVTRGTYAESTYVMRLKLFRTTKPFPTVAAALGIRATPLQKFNMNGQPFVDGHAWNEDGTALMDSTLPGYAPKPGIGVMNTTDKGTVTSGQGSGTITGSPPMAIDTNTIDPLPFLDIYKNNAAPNIFYGPQTLNQDFGTVQNPVIVYCDSGTDTTKEITFSGNGNSYGILVIRGNIKFGGTSAWHGLVIIDGMNSSVTMSESGSPSIIGGCIVAGNAGASVTLNGKGTGGKILYSPDALAKAKNIGKLRYYTILDWFE